MKPRFLITTAEEHIWPADGPVLFLGEWCKRYSRREVWSKMDAQVVPYHWDDREKFHRDHLYLKALCERLLASLAGRLNEIHGVDHNLRYWRILLGPWLGFFVQMVFDRWEAVHKALSGYPISGCRIDEGAFAGEVPNDMVDFQRRFLADRWNQNIFSLILSHCSDVPCERVVVHEIPPDGDVPFPRRGFVNRLKGLLVAGAGKVLSTGVGPGEAFFIADYLPLLHSLALQAKLGQVPRLWQRQAPPVVSADPQRRRWRVADCDGNDFERFLSGLIPLQIPTLYLEGYGALMDRLSGLSWPESPRFIFTSVAHESDDLFKAWAAAKAEAGVPLIIGQHGGHYGSGLWSFVEEHELAISDRYLTWGWKIAGTQKVVPAVATRSIGQGRGRWSPGGDALLVTYSLPRYGYFSFSAPQASQWISYFNDQCRFVEALPEPIRRRLLVRLYQHDYGWDQVLRWRDRFPGLRLDDGTGEMEPLIRRSRLYISTYNATTFLETMSRDIPTLIFWDPGFWELRDDALPCFEELKRAGILHETPEGAAAKVAEIWNEMPGWWTGKGVQAARARFSDRFARLPKHPHRVLKEALTWATPTDSGAISQTAISNR